MAKKQVQTAQPLPPPKAIDDFKAISGISPAVERRLHTAGVHTYAQLAAMSPADIAQLLAGSGASIGKISRQDWVGKARALSAAKDAPAEETELVYRQHYAMFTVKLLLNEDNEVRYTEVKHVGSDGKDNWAGWNEPSLVQFFAEHAELKLPPQLPSPQPEEAALAQSSGMDVTRGATRVEAQAYTPLTIALTEVGLDEVEFQPQNGRGFPGRRLRANIAFDLAGDDAREAAAAESAYAVQALARQQTGQTTVLGIADGQLRADSLTYAASVEFDLPPVGRYQLFGMALLPRELVSGVKQGPAFKVVP